MSLSHNRLEWKTPQTQVSDLPDLSANPRYKPPKNTAKKSGKRSKKSLKQQAKVQPRDSTGKFAKTGNFFAELFGVKRPLNKLQKPVKKVAPKPQAKKRRKKPLLERGFLGRVAAIFTGEWAAYSRRQARKKSRILNPG